MRLKESASFNLENATKRLSNDVEENLFAFKAPLIDIIDLNTELEISLYLRRAARPTHPTENLIMQLSTALCVASPDCSFTDLLQLQEKNLHFHKIQTF